LRPERPVTFSGVFPNARSSLGAFFQTPVTFGGVFPDARSSLGAFFQTLGHLWVRFFKRSVTFAGVFPNHGQHDGSRH
jgi:hypothetical protein